MTQDSLQVVVVELFTYGMDGVVNRHLFKGPFTPSVRVSAVTTLQ